MNEKRLLAEYVATGVLTADPTSAVPRYRLISNLVDKGLLRIADAESHPTNGLDYFQLTTNGRIALQQLGINRENAVQIATSAMEVF